VKAEHRQALMWLAAAIVFFLAICITMRTRGEPLPPTLSIHTNEYFFSATATDDVGLESDQSNVVVVRSDKSQITVRLAWDPSPGTNVITNYTVGAGYWSNRWSWTTNAGTNLTATMRIPYPVPPVDHVITVGATNAPSISLTNPRRLLYFRSHSWKVKQVWPTELQVADSPDGPWSVLVGPVTNQSEPSVSLRISMEALPSSTGTNQ